MKNKRYIIWFNPLSANLAKWPTALKQFVGSCRRIVWVFYHFVRLALKGLKIQRCFKIDDFGNFGKLLGKYHLWCHFPSNVSGQQVDIWIVCFSRNIQNLRNIYSTHHTWTTTCTLAIDDLVLQKLTYF